MTNINERIGNELFFGIDPAYSEHIIKEARVSYWEKNQKIPSNEELDMELLQARRRVEFYYEGLFACKI